MDQYEWGRTDEVSDDDDDSELHSLDRGIGNGPDRMRPGTVDRLPFATDPAEIERKKP